MKTNKISTRNIGIASIILIIVYVLTSLSFVVTGGGIQKVLSPLNKVASPYFSQSWNIFAPNIAKSNSSLRFQVELTGGPEDSVTEWVDITKIEQEAASNGIIFSRVGKNSWNLLNRYQSRFSLLNEDQRSVFKSDLHGQIPHEFTQDDYDQLQKDLTNMGDNGAEVREFLKYDAIMQEFVSYFADSYFGEEKPARIRWQIYRTYPNDFEFRYADKSLKQPTTTTFGWRPISANLKNSRLDAFADFIDSAGKR